ncbi:MAG TPA: prefoldin subunit beta [Methanolinea sp.]|jgi:prefoldin beta subunit|nr:prefoldin subunit beta [Methanolinea sp.]MDI6898821.1 prefoldin subunit beta [Methanolinea sp.]HOS82198.1 prefoldin subunit beta [Methanolinea sp.]HPC55918.1 prefoldin subunit beta [Methanolinea sp.]HQE85444.1 prefoldin subunit beta [Methanolinea sp.]
MNTISPKIQNQIAQLQQMQQQMQTIGAQKSQYELAVREARRATEELKDVPDDNAVFMSVGSVLMQKKKEEVLAKLNEKIETLELRIKSLEKQETLLQGKFEQLQAQVKQALEGKPAPGAA